MNPNVAVVGRRPVIGREQILGFLAGWVIPSGTRGVLNDAISIYFADATLASAFVARWCVGSKAETAGGVFQVGEDEPTPRIGARLHRTP